MGIRLMIIKLRRYNEIGTLLIENGTAGSQGQVSYRDGFRVTFLTRVTVHMGVKDMGMRMEYRGACNWPPSWDPDQECVQALRSN